MERNFIAKVKLQAHLPHVARQGKLGFVLWIKTMALTMALTLALTMVSKSEFPNPLYNHIYIAQHG